MKYRSLRLVPDCDCGSGRRGMDALVGPVVAKYYTTENGHTVLRCHLVSKVCALCDRPARQELDRVVCA